MRNAMRYTLSLPVSTVLVGCDNIAQLEENMQIARELTPLSQSQMAALGNRIAPVARQFLFFHFETRPSDIGLSWDNGWPGPRRRGSRLLQSNAAHATTATSRTVPCCLCP